MSQFQEDLIAARPAEILVLQVLSSLTNKYNFVDIAAEPQYYDYGDILATGEDGSEFFIDVKNDSRIWETKNILCEELVYDKRSDREKIGFMYSNYNYICIVSQRESRIYVIDFDILKQIYKKGEFRVFNHPTQYTEGYLLNIATVKKYKGLKAIINYEEGSVVCY